MSLESLFVLPLENVVYSKESDIHELSKAKSALENNLQLLFDHLAKHKCDLDTPLLTADGFPRSDIDIVQVRITRSKIHVYRNDLKEVIELAANKLSERFSINNEIRVLKLDDKVSQQQQQSTQSEIPFAIVTQVVDHSPAAAAGLLVNDKIIQIESINVTNHGNLQRLAGLVQNSEDKRLKVVISRDDEIIEKSLTPTKNWPGQGLLGCKLNLI